MCVSYVGTAVLGGGLTFVNWLVERIVLLVGLGECVCFLIHTRRPLPSFPVDVSLLLLLARELFGSCFSSGYRYAEGLCVAAHNTQACQQSIILGDVLLLHTAAADTPFFTTTTMLFTHHCCCCFGARRDISTYLSR